jgi:hypothetical protein
MKMQYFNDGNKRTALLFANMLLLSKEWGFIKIPDDQTSEFFKNLINFYEDKISKSQFIKFIHDKYLIKSFNPVYHKHGIETNKAESIEDHIKIQDKDLQNRGDNNDDVS